MRQIAHEIKFCIEDTRSIIHRATNQTIKWKQGSVERFTATKSLIFRTTGRLVTNQVRISTAKSGRTHSFMGIYANLILGSFSHGVQIMVVHPLTVVMLSTRNHIAYITTLHCIVTVVYHKLVGFIHMTFIIAYGCRSFMMHHQFHTLTFSVSVQHLYIKVRIWSYKIKYIIFRMTEPVFPSFVPTFYQHLIKSIFSCKVYITFYVFIGSTMTSVRFSFGIVRFTQFYRRQIIGISPSALSGNHFPPYAYIFHRLNPGNIFISTRLIQIQRQFGIQNITGVITYDNRTPRRLTGSLQVSFISFCIRGKPGFEYKILIIQIKMHTGVIHQSSLMQVNIKTVSCFHLQRSLYTRRRERSL